MKEEILLEVKNLKKYYPIKTGLWKKTIAETKAVDGVSFAIRKGTTLGLVGESGCGKSTLGRTLLRLEERTEGEVYFKGRELFSLSQEELRKERPHMQMIFQDPYASLPPRMKVKDILGEAVKVHGLVPEEELDAHLSSILEACGLPESAKENYPHEFSGGQRQRICIARALALNPDFILCDEPVSALDVSIQAQILNLLKDLQEQYGLTYLFISHDLSVVEYVSDTIAVMYLGRLVEMAPTEELFHNPLHPYTEALLSAIPVADPDVERKHIALSPSMSSPMLPSAGCPFHTRCPKAQAICRSEAPVFRKTEGDHWCACHLH